MRALTSSMKSRALFAAAILIGCAGSAAAQAPAPVPPPPQFEYAVKFVCGRSAVQKQIGLQVAPGFYWTDINVHNPNNVAIGFRKKFVLALINQEPSKPTDFSSKELVPDSALAVECAEILKRLGPPSPPFATGFAVFQSSRELDIVAVYTTASAPNGPVSTFHTERVPKRP